ncbi:MAG: redox-regulated ATPase YchF [Phycisphaerales bacterium]
MEIGIVGLPNVGKSALFKALTGMAVEVGNYPFTTTRPTRGTAPVPDPRLAIINEFIDTKKLTPATIDLVDVPALVTGSSKGEGIGNAFLDTVRQVDALAHVVRCFDDPDVAHEFDDLDPVRDVETVDTELLLADLGVLESASERAERRARTGDAEARKRVDLCARATEVLENERPLRSASWTDAELKDLRALGMITLRPVLYIANVGEDDPTGDSALVSALRQAVVAKGGAEGQVVSVCASIEAELADLDEPDREEMLQGLGLTEPALGAVARALYDLLGLQSFYTAGEKEIRAWTVRAGATAPEAAGVIHSDIQRGFIRSETYSVTDLQEYRAESKIRSAGKMRSEGKHYILRDGDVCHFLFNV